MMRQRIAALVETALQAAATTKELVTSPFPAAIIGVPANPEHGDFSCNIAMQIAKGERKAPRQVAETIIRLIGNEAGLLSKCEIAGPGFINFFVAPAAWQEALLEIEAQGATFGRTK